MAQRTREVIMADVAAAEGEIACKIAMALLEVELDNRDLLTAIEGNQAP